MYFVLRVLLREYVNIPLHFIYARITCYQILCLRSRTTCDIKKALFFFLLHDSQRLSRPLGLIPLPRFLLTLTLPSPFSVNDSHYHSSCPPDPKVTVAHISPGAPSMIHCWRGWLHLRPSGAPIAKGAPLIGSFNQRTHLPVILCANNKVPVKLSYLTGNCHRYETPRKGSIFRVIAALESKPSRLAYW